LHLKRLAATASKLQSPLSGSNASRPKRTGAPAAGTNQRRQTSGRRPL